MIYSELSNILPRALKGEHSAKGTEKCKIPGNLLNKEVEILEDPKVQHLVGEEDRICWSYPFRHKTTHHLAECKVKLFGIWMMRHLML